MKLIFACPAGARTTWSTNGDAIGAIAPTVKTARPSIAAGSAKSELSVVPPLLELLTSRKRALLQCLMPKRYQQRPGVLTADRKRKKKKWPNKRKLAFRKLRQDSLRKAPTWQRFSLREWLALPKGRICGLSSFAFSFVFSSFLGSFRLHVVGVRCGDPCDMLAQPVPFRSSRALISDLSFLFLLLF